MAKSLVATGSVTGTGSDIVVSTDELSFKPVRVEVRNLTSGDELVWTPANGDGGATKRVAAGTASVITSGGIKDVALDTFTIGTDADVNASGESLAWTAFGQ